MGATSAVHVEVLAMKGTLEEHMLELLQVMPRGAVVFDIPAMPQP